MEIHQLRYFVAVAQEGSFSRAAERVRVAQPSLSQQIQKLEAEVGQPLFDRLPRGIALTEAGHQLLPFARRILTDLGDAQRCVDECRGGVAGAVTIGLIPTIAPYVLGPLLSIMGDRYPAVTVHVLEDVTERLVRALQDGEIDLAMVSTCRPVAGTHRETCRHEPLLAVLPATHPAATQTRVSVAALRGEPVLTLAESHCLSQQVGRWCQRHGLRPRTGLPAVQLATIVALVAAGQGVSLLPAMAVAHEQGRGCAFRPLQDGAPEREINLLRNPARFQSKAAAALAEVAREVVGATGRPGVPVPAAGAAPTPVPGAGAGPERKQKARPRKAG